MGGQTTDIVDTMAFVKSGKLKAPAVKTAAVLVKRLNDGVCCSRKIIVPLS